MNESTIKENHIAFRYKHKEDTESSFYLLEGKADILPARISFSRSGFIEITYKGRARTENKIGQINGQFKKIESSPYKQFKPFNIFSSIWEAKGFPEFFGYGDIGFTSSNGRIKASKDLFIISSIDSGLLEIHLFIGLADIKEECFEYLLKHKRNGTLEKAPF